MGNMCGRGKHAKQVKESGLKIDVAYSGPDDVPAITYGAPGSAGGFGGPEVRMLICAMDYKRTSNPLTCTVDAGNMLKLAQACRIQDIQVLTDEQRPLTKDMAISAIQQMTSRCNAGDQFVFYYSGHGTQLGDVNEGSGHDDEEDDAYCFQDDMGQVNYESCLSDDAFAEVLSSSLPDEVQLLVLSDCCHSDTICDFSKPLWTGKEAVSISGCQDNQTSGDTGNGGICTHSMLLAVDVLNQAADQGLVDPTYSVGQLYNCLIKQKHKVFPDASQLVSIETPDEDNYSYMRWPLIPKGPYYAPMHRQEAPMAYGAPMTYGAPSPNGGGGSGGKVQDHIMDQCADPEHCGELDEDDFN
eukprot:TRINITY_DN54266_c0_g1_i1.p2 TRINITY_DN54266_c0_g1~~TRINITY_DN54266_c0_g1_i1.p2  ORF type:complete len:383 (-),score=80.42 TRINITY_DN54266_c0_g1_i1:81-1148(-)